MNATIPPDIDLIIKQVQATFTDQEAAQARLQRTLDDKDAHYAPRCSWPRANSRDVVAPYVVDKGDLNWLLMLTARYVNEEEPPWVTLREHGRGFRDPEPPQPMRSAL